MKEAPSKNTIVIILAIMLFLVYGLYYMEVRTNENRPYLKCCSDNDMLYHYSFRNPRGAYCIVPLTNEGIPINKVCPELE
jgi:hypothetical protein